MNNEYRCARCGRSVWIADGHTLVECDRARAEVQRERERFLEGDTFLARRIRDARSRSRKG